jgi:hypothetical protein
VMRRRTAGWTLSSGSGALGNEPLADLHVDACIPIRQCAARRYGLFSAFLNVSSSHLSTAPLSVLGELG